MSKQWHYQLRIDLGDDLAEAARRDPTNSAIKPLADILTRHHATMKCQFDAFADYVAEAEKRGTKDYPLYAWTKATIKNREKKAKYLRSFTLYVDGNEVYAKPLADALEADLQPLVGSVITRLSKYDTNPANNPQGASAVSHLKSKDRFLGRAPATRSGQNQLQHGSAAGSMGRAFPTCLALAVATWNTISAG
jgi:hypothetical protein